MLVKQSAVKVVVPFITVIFLAIAFGLFPDSAWAASHSENENLSSEEVADRFALIDSSYEIGEAFSEGPTPISSCVMAKSPRMGKPIVQVGTSMSQALDMGRPSAQRDPCTITG